MTTSGIFISYRRDDTRQAAGRLADDLGDALGTERIFRDIEKIEIGVDFEQALNQALVNCEVMLVLIGRQWLTVTDAQGQRRLDQPGDWIRTEIVTALRRGIRVVPVLVDGAALPAEADLPEDLRPLVRRQALAIEDARWKSDVARLAESLARVGGRARAGGAAAVATPAAAPVPAPAPQAATGSLRKGIMIGAAAVVVLLVALVMVADENVAGTWTRTEPDQAFAITQADDGRLQVTLTDADGTVRRGTGKVSRSKVSFEIAAPEAAADDAELSCELEYSSDPKTLTGSCGSDAVTLTHGT